MKIGILGNSVSMIMRPPRENKSDKTYAEIMEGEYHHQIIHAGKRGVMINDAYSYLEDEIIRHSPDLIVIHFGIVEAATRIRDRYIYKHSEREDYKNSIFLSKYPRNFIDKMIDWGLISVGKCLEIMRRIFNKRISWLSEQHFEYVLDAYISQIKKELCCPIIILGVANPGELMEKKCPGTMERVRNINAIFEKRADPENGIYYIDVYSCEEMAGNVPDGSHFSAAGHKIIANEILSVISKISDKSN